jgi:hypothetical protein
MKGIPIFVTVSRPDLGPTKPPIQLVPGALFPGLSGRDVKLTTHFQVAPRLRMHGATPSLPQYEGESKSFRTGRLKRELQMIQLSATTCSCIVVL